MSIDIDEIILYSLSFDKTTKQLRALFAFNLYDSRLKEVERPSLIFCLKNGKIVDFDFENFPNYSKQERNKIINWIKRSEAFDFLSNIRENNADLEQITYSEQTFMINQVKKCPYTETFDIFFKLKGFNSLFHIIYRPQYKDFINLSLVIKYHMNGHHLNEYFFVNDILDEEKLTTFILKNPTYRLKLLFQ